MNLIASEGLRVKLNDVQYERYQALVLRAIYIRVPGEPGNEAMVS